jgi:hypothetical protein
MRIRAFESVVLCLCLLFLVSTISTAQARRVSDRQTCAACRITITQGPSLRTPANADAALPGRVRIDSLGRYWVFRVETTAALFDERGRFLQLLGPSGQGPGEYTGASDIVVLGRDSVAVIDNYNRRVTVVDRNLKPRRYVSLPLNIRDHILLQWPSSVVVHGSIPTPQAVGYPLHMLSLKARTGSLQRSFGPGEGEERPELLGSPFHVQAAGRTKSYWVAPRSNYDVFEIRDNGEVVQALERRPDWFNKPSSYNYAWKSEPPPPHVGAVAEDESGLLWVFIRVAAPTWREAWPKVPANVREVPINQIDYRKLYWTRVEVIDPKTARLVAQTMLRFYLVSALDRRRVALFDEDENGSVIRIFSLDVVR